MASHLSASLVPPYPDPIEGPQGAAPSSVRDTEPAVLRANRNIRLNDVKNSSAIGLRMNRRFDSDEIAELWGHRHREMVADGSNDGSHLNRKSFSAEMNGPDQRNYGGDLTQKNTERTGTLSRLESTKNGECSGRLAGNKETYWPSCLVSSISRYAIGSAAFKWQTGDSESGTGSRFRVQNMKSLPSVLSCYWRRRSFSLFSVRMCTKVAVNQHCLTFQM